jgi:hypothetical protein
VNTLELVLSMAHSGLGGNIRVREEVGAGPRAPDTRFARAATPHSSVPYRSRGTTRPTGNAATPMSTLPPLRLIGGHHCTPQRRRSRSSSPPTRSILYFTNPCQCHSALSPSPFFSLSRDQTPCFTSKPHRSTPSWSESFNSRPAGPSLFLFLHTCAVAGDAPLMRVCVRWIDTLFCHGMCMASTWERTVIARSPIVRSPRKILSYNRTFQNGLLYSGPYHPIPLPPQLTPVV